MKVLQLCYAAIFAFCESQSCEKQLHQQQKWINRILVPQLPDPFDVQYLTVWVMAQESACLAVLSAGHCSSWHWQLPGS